MFKKGNNNNNENIKEYLSHFVPIDEILKKKDYIDEEQYKHLVKVKRSFIQKQIEEKIKNLNINI
jgi:hypothetical protein